MTTVALPDGIVLPDKVNLAQIGRLASVGRAAVNNWRRRFPSFPQPIGGTDVSPLFSLEDAVAWLRRRGWLVELPSRDQTDRAHLTAIQLMHALTPPAAEGSRDLDAHVETATGRAREALDQLRDFAAAADTRLEVMPVLMALASTAVSALIVLNGPDRVGEWLSLQSHTVQQHAVAGAHRADETALAITSFVTAQIGEPDAREWYQHTYGCATRRALSFVRDEHAAGDRYELLLATGWLATYLLAAAMGHEQQRMTDYLTEHARQIIG
ncbi:hypothetical protein [Streptomyces abikoensis]